MVTQRNLIAALNLRRGPHAVAQRVGPAATVQSAQEWLKQGGRRVEAQHGEPVPGRKHIVFTSRVHSRTSTSTVRSNKCRKSRFTIVASATAFALAATVAIAALSARSARASDPASGTGARWAAVYPTGALPAVGQSAGASTASPFIQLMTVHSIAVGAESGALRAREIAWGMLPRFGWRPRFQFRYLRWLWDRESSWNVYATNPYSGAYGIPQAVPGWKMASAGWNWRTSARTQIRWGLRYIRSRYGSPRAAWYHEVYYGWY